MKKKNLAIRLGVAALLFGILACGQFGLGPYAWKTPTAGGPATAPASGPAVSLTPVASASAPPAATSPNPFGIMIGSAQLDVQSRIDIAKELGVAYFRPNAVFVENWSLGQCLDCDAARAAGLKLVLTVRNNGRGLGPTTPPQGLEIYKQTLSQILDVTQPAILVVENEENSKTFYAGTPEEYGTELQAACQVAHSKNIPCTNGGIVSTLVAMLVYNDYQQRGLTAQAEAFANRAFDPQDKARLGGAAAQEAIQKGQDLLRIYAQSDIDYFNFHWYISDPDALQEAVDFLHRQLPFPLMTNEMGQHDTRPEGIPEMLSKVLELNFPYAIWYSIDSPQAKALINPDGSLRSNGEAFQTFVNERFP